MFIERIDMRSITTPKKGHSYEHRTFPTEQPLFPLFPVLPMVNKVRRKLIGPIDPKPRD